MKNMFKLIPFILVLSFLISCSAEKKEEPMKTAEITRGNILAVIPSTGVVMPRNRLEIKPPVAGRIESVLIKEGQGVRAGQILAWMSSAERATLLDAARSKGAEEVAHWEDVYKPAPIIAPLNGFIIQRNVEPGQSVNINDAVLVMADKLIIKAEVDETDIGKIKKGQNVENILDAYPSNKILGKVEHIAYESQTINNVTVYVVDVLPKKVPEFFRSGMSATVNFMLDARQNVLVVPIRAIKKISTRSYVFMKDENDKGYKTVQVQTGLENTEHVEIVSGLNEGDEIIIPTAKMTQELQSRDERRGGPFNPFQRRN